MSLARSGDRPTTREALLVPVHLLVIIFGFSILPGGWTERRSAIGPDDGQDLNTTQADSLKNVGLKGGVASVKKLI